MKNNVGTSVFHAGDKSDLTRGWDSKGGETLLSSTSEYYELLNYYLHIMSPSLDNLIVVGVFKTKLVKFILFIKV